MGIVNELAETGSGRTDQSFVEFYQREHVGQVRRAAMIVGLSGRSRATQNGPSRAPDNPVGGSVLSDSVASR